MTCERTLIFAQFTLWIAPQNLQFTLWNLRLSLGSAVCNMDWRIFIDTISRLLYTKPASKSQTNNSYDYENFIIVIILISFLSADPKPDIWLRIWSQNSVPVRQEIPFWWKIQCREHLIWLIFLHTHLCKKQQKIHPIHWKKHNILLS